MERKFGAVDEKSVVSKRLRLFTDMNFSHVALKDLANEICLSEKYVSRVFKKENDVNFREYKIGLKIERAKALLKKTAYPVYKISGILGYRNPETFMRIFKRKTSFTPLQYREQVS
ncbi:MAG: AraC family transcriptional regulator [Candidatus Omnitrophota bacterium]